MKHFESINKVTQLCIVTLTALVIGRVIGVSAAEPLFTAQVEYFRKAVTGFVAIDDNGDIYSSNGREIDMLVNDGTGDYVSSSFSPDTAVSWYGPFIAADLDGDGHTDLALANDRSLSVVMGGAPGILNGLTDYDVGASHYANLYSMIAGDVDGDNDIDLVATSSDGIHVVANDGTGVFDSAVVYSGSLVFSATSGGDFDGDDDVDLAAVAWSDNLVAIFLNAGDGTLEPASEYPVGSLPQAVVAGDLNNDGDVDIATVNKSSNDVSVLLGNGDGTFGAALHYAAGFAPSRLCLIDLKSDGLWDLAVSSADSQFVSLLINDGGGAFDERVVYGVTAKPLSLAAQDVNGDGFHDLIFGATALASGVSILFSDLEGHLLTAPEYSIGSGDFARIANVNGDIYPDLLHASGSLLGRGDGTFYSGPPLSDSAGSVPFGPIDIDGDGDDDLARFIGNADDSLVLEIRMNDGHGVFDEPSTYAAGNGGWLEAGDLDGNGTQDLVVALNDYGFIVVLNLWGTLYPDTTRYGEWSFSEYVPRLILDDIDRDDDLDVVVAGLDFSTNPPRSIAVFRNNGDGTFASPSYHGTDFPDHITSVVTGNIDGDGDQDVLLSLYRPVSGSAPYDVFSMLRNYGTGTFSAPIKYTSDRVAPYIGTLAAVDVDDDNDLDVVMGDTPYGGFAVWSNRGPGTFDAPNRTYGLSLATPYTRIDGADLDQDGDQDIVVSISGSVGILINRSRSPLTSITAEDAPGQVPQTYGLAPNYPNPFNPSTTIGYSLVSGSEVALDIFNIMGQRVKTLVNGRQSLGHHSVTWDGKNDRGQAVASGVYFYRLLVGDAAQSRKMVLLR